MTDRDHGPHDHDQLEGGRRNTDEDRAAAMSPTSERHAPGRSPLRMRIIIATLAAAGIAVLVVAALVGTTGNETAGCAAVAQPAVERVIPECNDEVLQQQRVGVVLDPRYRLTALVVYPNDRFSGGVDVSEEAVEVEGLNLFEFAPGEGRLIESLSPDTNCVLATFVLIARPEESGTAEWCFEVS